MELILESTFSKVGIFEPTFPKSRLFHNSRHGSKVGSLLNLLKLMSMELTFESTFSKVGAFLLTFPKN